MSDQGIDFGQSSQLKYSLTTLTTPQIAGTDIARDVAQAIQVGGNLGKYVEQEKDKATQARYFNSVTEFNNLRSDQQQELFDAGLDLDKQRSVMDKYKSKFVDLSTKYELDDKYKAQLGSSVESHVNGLEEKYRTLYNARRGDIAEANMAEVAATLTASRKEDAIPTLQALKEYYKTETGADDRTAGVKVAKQYINAKLSSIDTDNMTFEEAKTLKSDLKTILTSADNKITTDIYFKDTMLASDRIVEAKRREEEGRLQDLIKVGQTSEKAMNQMISNYRSRGIITTDEQALLYRETYKNNLLEKDARAEALRYRLDSKAAQDAEWRIVAGKYKTVDELRGALDNNPEFKNLIPDHKEAIIGRFGKDIAKEENKALKANYKEILGFVDTNMTPHLPDGTSVTPEMYTLMQRTVSEDGSLNEAAQKANRQFSILYKADKNKEEFAKIPMYTFGAGQQDAKTVANSLIDSIYNSNDANKYQVLSQLHSNYGVKGNISQYIEKDLQDPTKFKETYQKYVTLKQSLPSAYTDILGKDNVAKLEMVNNLMLKNKLQEPTPDIYRLADELYKQKVVYSTSDQKDIQNALNRNQFVDTSGFLSDIEDFRRMGMTMNSSIKAASEKRQQLKIGDSIDLTGLERELNTKQKDLLQDTLSHVQNKYSVDKGNSPIVGLVYNKGTGTMWWSIKGNTYGINEGLSFDAFMSKYARELEKNKTKQINPKEFMQGQD